jgi:hypothetical protein
VEVAIDERWRYKALFSVDNATSLTDDVRLDGDNLATCARNINAYAAIGKTGVANENVKQATSFQQAMKMDQRQ